MNKKIYFLVFSLAFSLSSALFAHAGHGNESDSSSLMHYFTEPLHLGIGVVAIGIIGFVSYKLKQSKLMAVRKK